MKDLAACFLTYHTISSSFQGKPTSFQLVFIRKLHKFLIINLDLKEKVQICYHVMKLLHFVLHVMEITITKQETLENNKHREQRESYEV